MNGQNISCVINMLCKICGYILINDFLVESWRDKILQMLLTGLKMEISSTSCFEKLF